MMLQSTHALHAARPPVFAVVSQWCYIGVTLVLQWCCSGVTVMLQWYCSGVTVV
jgi:hypothetical protein